MRQALGGFGGESDYKDAAQEFIDAWVDAFNEGEDTLQSLQDKLDEYINNLVKKQAMQRVANKYLRSMFEYVDHIVDEKSDGGILLTQNELANLNEMGQEKLKALNSALYYLMGALNFTGTGTAGLSALTQSIQGITENTAETLESLLTSIWYSVHQQTADITEIKNHLLRSADEENPMLKIMKEQLGYLRNLSNRIDSVDESQ